LPPKVERLAEHLARIAAHPHVGDVRQRGLIGAIELVRDKDSRQPFPWEEKRGMAVCDFARGQGVLARPLGSVLVIFPPLSITLDELDRICTALEAGIVAVTE
jgi:adenosylmethionine-8-amino-7-oxononanoate aminotransferase